MLCPGQVYEAAITVQGIDAPPNTATLTITLPDQSTVEETGPWEWAQSGTGWTATFDYTLPTAGLFQFAWVTTGPGTAPFPDFVNVRRAASIVSVAEMLLHLNKKGIKNPPDSSSASDVDELSSFMMAATELVEDRVGVCVPRQFTDQVDEGRFELVVPRMPILSVQSVASVWVGGPVWDNVANPGLLKGTEHGTIYRPTQDFFWWPPWDVVYTCGRAEVPERWVHAAKEQVRHLWETQRGGMPPAVLQGEEVFSSTVGFTFSVPRRVLELLETDMVPSS